MQEQFAQEFAIEWVKAWNSHDIDTIMEHYAEQLSFQSPVIVKVNNDPSGTIHDKTALRAYFERALKIYPDLHFELYGVFVSINSVILHYKSINNMVAAEYMELDEQGRVRAVRAHYCSTPTFTSGKAT